MSTSYTEAGEHLYVPERRLEALQQPWEGYQFGGSQSAGPRSFYHHEALQPSSSGLHSSAHYNWQGAHHLQAHTPQAYSGHDAVTPEPEMAQYASISPQRISPAPHSAPAVVPSNREHRTPSPTAEELPEDAFVPAHYQPRGLNLSPERIAKPQAQLSAPQQQQMPALGDQAGEDTSMRCTDFVAKLWFLLDRPEYKSHIRWNTNGDSFIFFPTTAFATDVLARLFKHSNVASFVRQLNLYGFQRISHLELLEDLTPEDTNDDSSIPASGFSHPDFVKGRPAALGKIRPKPSPSRARKASGKRKARGDDDDEAAPRRRRN